MRAATPRIFILLILGVSVAALAGCVPEAPQPRVTTTGEPASPTQASTLASGSCPNAGVALGDGERAGGTLSADVDGDGASEEIYLVLDDAASAGCRAFLVARGTTGTWAAPTQERGVEYALATPRLNAVVPVDTRPGAEVVVDVEQGASTQFVALFTFVDGALRRVEAEGAPGLPGGLLPYGGSVGHIEATDCAPEAGADVVVSTAAPLGKDYELQRRFFALQGAELVPVADLDERQKVAAEEIASFPEFASGPFGSCGDG